ncbi:MAG: succinate dehydrogenase/fumarate reductase iron-sulfur subunit [Myxococcales bacterium]|nr:succinate dehydrogenase/fumarate reductase iron-sulfur subunit [Myxococcales bacterium]
MAKRKFRVWRGNAEGGEFETYEAEVSEGMVVLDVLHEIQAQQAGDLAIRWNCKAGKCGSCSMEINGRPRLACMTRMNIFEPGETLTIQPLKTFPIIKDLVTDVSWNYEQNQRIKPFTPRAREADGEHRMYQQDVDRVQEYRKCIECFLCQTVCHVLRDRDGKDRFSGPRFMIRAAGLEMNPLDDADRIPEIRDELGSGMCNITRCCTEVCPEHINITDNGIIPLKERVVDRYYDPLRIIGRKLLGKKVRTQSKPYQAPKPPKPRFHDE